MNKERSVVRKEFRKKFDGTILITDPCYFIPIGQWEKYIGLYNDSRTYLKETDQDRLSRLEDSILKSKSWINFYEGARRQGVTDKDLQAFDQEVQAELNNIERYKQEIEALQKEGSTVDKTDENAPVEDFLKDFGLTDCLAGPTIYGDGSYTVYEEGKELGQFCIDSGSYGIFYLDEVLKLNPDFDKYPNMKHTFTSFYFRGVIKVKIVDTYYSDNRKRSSVVIEGEGNINFYTRQTGL